MKTSIPVIQPIALEIDEDADHLVADEYLLHACDQGLIGPSLRLWQVRGPMVVLGYGNVLEKEARVVACQQRGIPMHRRSSGEGRCISMPDASTTACFCQSIPTRRWPLSPPPTSGSWSANARFCHPYWRVR